MTDAERIAAGLSEAHVEALNGSPTDDMPSQVALDFIKWKLIRPVLKDPFTTRSLFGLGASDLTMAWSPLGQQVRTILEQANAK